jgi:predicted transcriptional regulator
MISMQSDENAPAPDLVTLAGDVVSAYVTKNTVRTGDLPALIASVHAAFAGLGKPQAREPDKPTPRIPIRKTITPDHLISLETASRTAPSSAISAVWVSRRTSTERSGGCPRTTQ